ncbi:hypothetical protein D3C78_1430180 [compost metagenome]
MRMFRKARPKPEMQFRVIYRYGFAIGSRNIRIFTVKAMIRPITAVSFLPKRLTRGDMNGIAIKLAPIPINPDREISSGA